MPGLEGINPLNPAQPSNTEPDAPSDIATDRSPQVQVSLNAMNDPLLHFDCTLGTKEPRVTVRAMIDSGASHSFISPRVLEGLGADISIYTRKKELEVTLPNSSYLRIRTSIFLLVRIGS